MSDIKIMNLRRDDRCGCGAATPRGSRAGWDRERRVVVCLSCLPGVGRRRADVPADTTDPTGGVSPPGRRRAVQPPPLPIEVGVPGQSLVAEFARRQAKAETEYRKRHPVRSRWFGVRAPLAPSARAFMVGAEGEQLIADQVVRATVGRGFWMFNRSLGRRAGDIDVLGVLDSGIWIVDAKHYRGRQVTVKDDIIVVGSRRRPGLTESMWRQISAVTAAVPGVPVHPAICIVGGRVPADGARAEGIVVTDVEGLTRAMSIGGPIDEATRGEIVQRLAAALPAAA